VPPHAERLETKAQTGAFDLEVRGTFEDEPRLQHVEDGGRRQRSEVGGINMP
jgi:hypothetical protein